MNGMLIPSGNDAAFCLAENVGALLYYEKRGYLHINDLNILKVQYIYIFEESERARRCGIKFFMK